MDTRLNGATMDDETWFQCVGNIHMMRTVAFPQEIMDSPILPSQAHRRFVIYLFLVNTQALYQKFTHQQIMDCVRVETENAERWIWRLRCAANQVA